MAYKKIEDRIQDFIYEVRIWQGTEAGTPETSIAIPFPVTKRRLYADAYAIDASVAIWGYCIRERCADLDGAALTTNRMQKLFDRDSLDAIDSAIDGLESPLFGMLVRRPTRIMAGQRIQEFCTQELPNLKTRSAVTAADRTIRRLSA
jgi:hypothetical protein